MKKLDRALIKVRVNLKNGMKFSLRHDLIEIPLEFYKSWEQIHDLVKSGENKLKDEFKELMDSSENLTFRSIDGNKIYKDDIANYFVTTRFYTETEYNTDKGLTYDSARTEFTKQFA